MYHEQYIDDINHRNTGKPQDIQLPKVRQQQVFSKVCALSTCYIVESCAFHSDTNRHKSHINVVSGYAIHAVE